MLRCPILPSNHTFIRHRSSWDKIQQVKNQGCGYIKLLLWRGRALLVFVLQMLGKHRKTSLSTSHELVNHNTITYKMLVNKPIKRYVTGTQDMLASTRWSSNTKCKRNISSWQRCFLPLLMKCHHKHSAFTFGSINFILNLIQKYLLSCRHITEGSALCAPAVEFPHTYATSAQTTCYWPQSSPTG
jgi:hypothetical protein